MGVIQRQGIKRSIVAYVGVVIGVISSLWIYPNDLEAYGYIQFLISTASFLVPFASFGTMILAIRYFPKYRSEDGRHGGFFMLVLLIMHVSLFVFTLLAYLFWDPFLRGLEMIGLNSSLFQDNAIELLLTTYTIMLMMYVTNYTSNFKRVALPTVFNNLLVKLAVPVAIWLSFKGLISQFGLAFSVIGAYFLASLLIMLYLIHLGQLSFYFHRALLKWKEVKTMLNYSLYSALGNMGTMLAFRIDAIMVASMLDLESTGVYTIALFLANMIYIPFNSIDAISTPIISDAWERNDLSQIEEIYKKGSITLMAIGGILFVLIWVNISEVFSLTTNEGAFSNAAMVVFYIGISKLFDVSSSVNNKIILMSPYYRVNLIAISILAVMNLFLNYYLIPEYGVVGSAIATCISVVCFNLFKLLFIWVKFGLLPFTRQNIVLLAIIGLTWVVGAYLYTFDKPIIDLVFRSAVCTIIYLPLLYFLRVSEDINLTIRRIIPWLP